MSLLFPDQIRIGLGASYAALARVKGNVVTHWQMQQFEVDGSQASRDAHTWQNALDTLSLWLTQQAPRGAQVSVMLSAELALLHLLPWRADITGAKQQELLAKGHFRRVRDGFSEAWKTAVTPTGYGSPWLASATDGALLQSLQQLVAHHGARLLTVMPLSIALFNHFRNRLEKSASWLLVAEPGTLAALHVRDKQWHILQMLPFNALQREPVAQMLLRESRLAGLADQPATIYLASSTGHQGPGNDAMVNEMDGYIALNAGWHAAANVVAQGHLHLLGGTA